MTGNWIGNSQENLRSFLKSLVQKGIVAVKDHAPQYRFAYLNGPQPVDTYGGEIKSVYIPKTPIFLNEEKRLMSFTVWAYTLVLFWCK